MVLGESPGPASSFGPGLCPSSPQNHTERQTWMSHLQFIFASKYFTSLCTQLRDSSNHQEKQRRGRVACLVSSFFFFFPF